MLMPIEVNPDDVETLLTEVLEKDETDRTGEDYAMLARSHSLKGEVDEAMRLGNKAVELDPECVGVFLWMSDAFLDNKDDDAYYTARSRFIELEPPNYCYDDSDKYFR